MSWQTTSLFVFLASPLGKSTRLLCAAQPFFARVAVPEERARAKSHCECLEKGSFPKGASDLDYYTLTYLCFLRIWFRNPCF